MNDGNQTYTQEQTENSKSWLYKKGQSGNPGGRPKGSITLKTYLKNKFNSMTDEEREEFLDGVNKIDIWRMVEGMPRSNTDITTNGESLQPLLVKFIDGTKSDADTNGVQETVG